MSQSIILKGIYKNNKTCIYGIHNPINNKSLNFELFQELKQKHFIFKDLLPKFKKTEIHLILMNQQSKRYKFDYSEQNLFECIKICNNDAFIK